MPDKTAANDRLHPELWAKIKNKWHRGAKGGIAGKWNARKAQLAVRDYKSASQKQFGDSGYRARKPRAAQNSLAKWTKEEWGYAGKPGRSRYLPRKVRDALTPAERKLENRKKGRKLGTKVPWSESVKAKMRAADVI